MHDGEVKRLLEEYNDEFIKFRRNVEDALENLEFDNFSPSLRKYIADGIKSAAGFEAEAGINGATARMFAQYEDSFTKSIAEVKAKADAMGAFLSLMASTGGGTIEYYEEDGEFYYTDALGSDPIPVSDADIAGIFISAINAEQSTETQIYLKANIIKFGENCSVDDDGNLRVKRIWNNNGTQYYAAVGSIKTGSWGDFGVYYTGSDGSKHYAWRIYQDSDRMLFEIENREIFGYNKIQDKTYPKGVWDFSSCTEVRGLGVVPVFAGE